MKKALICGYSGFIGQRLSGFLKKSGFEPEPLTRGMLKKGDDELSTIISNYDVVINLAGKSLFSLWTKKQKRQIVESRLTTTKKIVRAIQMASTKPNIFIQISAVGIYNYTGCHTEESIGFNTDFTGFLCQEWEKEALVASTSCRTIVFRSGIVLDNEGGALPKMAAPFKYGLGARLGNGKQIISWIHIDDLLNAFLFAINTESIRGIYNLVSPEPVSNTEFSKAIAKSLHRPMLFLVPSFILKAVLGPASVIILKSQCAIPKALQDKGFRFSFPNIQSALTDILSKNNN